jgi:integrase
MRYKEAFSLYKRRLQSGKVVIYYQLYDEDGNRICGHSTGMTTKSAAREYCHALMRMGKLLPEQQAKVPTFSEYAKDWWDFDTCAYLKRKVSRRKMSRGYAETAKLRMNKHIIPYFGKMRLDKITSVEVEDWLTSFSEKGLKNISANGYLIVLRVMLEEATRRRIIKMNPCREVEKLMEEKRNIEILTPDEVRKLFPADWGDVWDNYLLYLFNKLAACTGMRIGEILGLRGDCVFDSYIKVCGQYGRHGFGDTKTHKERDIPIPPFILSELQKLLDLNGVGYMFSENGGKSPIGRRRVLQTLYAAFENIGINCNERKRRNITFHSWRHFFNTTLRMANIADSKVQSVTGHSSQAMTERYTHFNNVEFTEVRQVQEDLFLPSDGVKNVEATDVIVT